MRLLSRVAAVLVLPVALGACGGDDMAEARCTAAPRALVTAIESGLNVSGGGSLRSAQVVKSNDFEQVWFVAADIEGAGLDSGNDIGVWATNSLDAGGGLIMAVDGVAREFSDWPDGGSTSANVRMTDDGASEAKSCVEDAL